jgi:hypothetical protein
MSAARDRSSVSTTRVGPLPTRSHTTFGGGPSAADRLLKSASFDTTASPRAAAYAHTARSCAPASPAKNTWSDPGNSAASSAGSFRDKFWSNSRASRGGPRKLAGGEGEAGPDVVGRQFGEVCQQLRDGHPAGEVFQHVSHRDPHATDAGLTAPFARLDGDELRVVHTKNLPVRWRAVNERAICSLFGEPVILWRRA